MRSLPDPGFAGDDGAADPATASALQEVAAGAPLQVALAALCTARVLVPVVAVAGESEPGPDGLEREKTTDMAAVLLTGRDGRRALLAFSDLDALRRWDAQARPVPVTAPQAAQAALAEGAAALVLDVAGPVQVPVEGGALQRLAEGQRLVRTGQDWSWVAPVV